MSIDMVTFTTLGDMAKDSNCSITNESLYYGRNCYETGMIQVLKGIAEDFHITAKIKKSDYTRRLNSIAVEKEEELAATFNPTYYALIKDYVDALTEADSSDAYDHYIQGFLDGYRYLAHRVAFNDEGGK
jgi:hypothetical protein